MCFEGMIVPRVPHHMPPSCVLLLQVYDRKHTQTDVPANVTVAVKKIPHEAVVNSGSFRMVGITAEDFIRVWSHEEERVKKSRLQMFKEKFAAVLPEQIPMDNIDVFSVMLHSRFDNVKILFASATP